MKLTIYKYQTNWYIASGHDNNGRTLAGYGKTHYEALTNALKA
jgi:hypothetical protein